MKIDSEKSKVLLIFMFGCVYYLALGWGFRFTFRQFRFSEVVMMQTDPLQWSFYYETAFFEFFFKFISASLAYAVLIYVLYQLALYYFEFEQESHLS